MLLTQQVINCSCCGKRVVLYHEDAYNITKLLQANVTGEGYKKLIQDIKDRETETLARIRREGNLDAGLERLIKQDTRGVLRYFRSVFKGEGDPEEVFYAMETSPRDTTAEYILSLLDGEGRVCSALCGKRLKNPEKVDKRLTVDLKKIYHVTELRLDEKARKKMADKIHNAYTHNKLNTLIYNQRLGQYVPLLFSNNKPYHLVSLYDKGVYINITPYAVWFTDEKTLETKVIFNNVYEHHKSSMQRIEEMGAEHPHTNAFEIAYNIYNGKKGIDILTK